MHSLVNALKEQKIVAGNQRLAERIVELGEVINVQHGAILIHQGGADNEVYLILEGSFHIVVGGKTLARRVATDHIGEMAAILPVQRRAASVIANEDSVVVRLSNSQMEELGEQFPQIWRTFARELAHRVEQRNTVASVRNEKVRVLVMAATPADEIKRLLASDGFEVDVWEEGPFRTGNYPIESLERKLDQADVAVAFANGESRDSIIFELGFFMGRLGRHRTFLVEAKGDEVKLPHELAGIHTIVYKEGGLAPASAKLAKLIAELGPNR
jgi:CRP/FNR family transcriptional regulator, cyclic AMP receptor protein